VSVHAYPRASSLLAGMFLGAPLLPHEIDDSIAGLACTQAASRTS
jgi:hypothetical protein